MSESLLSADTQVVLLLCGRFGGERQEAFQPLSARDYGALAKWLNGRELRPADLLTDSGREHLSEVHLAKLDRKRLEALLERGTAMALALERWNRGGLWVISRGDPNFPKRLRQKLKNMAPPLLYGAGEVSLLNMGGLAIIGSRDATESSLEFTRSVAAQCASEQISVVSGGARGVDSNAMQAATDAGGCAVGVMANDLLKACVNRQNRTGLQEGRLVLVSPFYPEAGFNAGNAMGRNKYIYALADRALVIDSALGSGGTWDGASEAIKEKWVPVYVRTPGNGLGNAALVEQGGIAFTYQADGAQLLSDVFSQEDAAVAGALEPEAVQPSLLDVAEAVPESIQPEAPRVASVDGETASAEIAIESVTVPEPVTPPVEDPALTVTAAASLDMYTEFADKLSLALASSGLTEEQLASAFGLEKSQTKVWLKRAAEEGRIEKLKKPVRYALVLQSSLLG